MFVFAVDSTTKTLILQQTTVETLFRAGKIGEKLLYQDSPLFLHGGRITNRVSKTHKWLLSSFNNPVIRIEVLQAQHLQFVLPSVSKNIILGKETFFLSLKIIFVCFFFPREKWWIWKTAYVGKITQLQGWTLPLLFKIQWKAVNKTTENFEIYWLNSFDKCNQRA